MTITIKDYKKTYNNTSDKYLRMELDNIEKFFERLENKRIAIKELLNERNNPGNDGKSRAFKDGD